MSRKNEIVGAVREGNQECKYGKQSIGQSLQRREEDFQKWPEHLKKKWKKTWKWRQKDSGLFEAIQWITENLFDNMPIDDGGMGKQHPTYSLWECEVIYKSSWRTICQYLSMRMLNANILWWDLTIEIYPAYIWSYIYT